MSKGGFPFAAAGQVPRLMEKFSENILKKYTPCEPNNDIKKTAKTLATVHVELILIHPFREGNGRVARLLADLMAAQAKLKRFCLTR